MLWFVGPINCKQIYLVWFVGLIFFPLSENFARMKIGLISKICCAASDFKKNQADFNYALIFLRNLY